MKNLLFFLLIGGLASLCSCTKSEQPSTQDLLIGQWNITSFIDMDGDEMVDNSDPDVSTTITLQFAADGKVTLELKYTELASGSTAIEMANGTYGWENDTTLRMSFTTPDNSVLTGVPVLTGNALSVAFSAVTPDGNGTVILKGERI
jgi:hypothetical protein